jgi:hypothetical protein
MSSLLTLLPALVTSMKDKGGSLSAGVWDAKSSANSSLVEYSKDLTAEFVTLLDDELVHQPYLGDVLQNALSIATAYYLRAASVDTTVGGVKVKDRLNKINPNRGGSMGGVLKSGIALISKESLHDGLPNYLSLEDNSQPLEIAGKKTTFKPKVVGAGPGSRYAEAVRSYDSMLVGKNIEVVIQEGDNSATLPVNVRLSVLGASSTEIVDILGLASQNNSEAERKVRFNSGQLKAVRDMIFCDDLIKLHTRTLMKEKSGFYAQTLARRASNRLAALSSGEMSVAAASNIVIISDVTAARLEARLGGKLERVQVREEVFATTGTMLLFVVNTKWENVTMYTKSLANSSTVSMRNIKMMNKDGGDGILESLQKMLAGKGPL